jgi:cell division septal protein FtsQ
MKSSLRSSKRRVLRKKKILRAWLLSILALFLISLTGLLFLRSSFIRISSISVQGGDAVLDGQIQSIAEKSIIGDYLWLIPKDSFFFFPSRRLSDSIPSEFPTVSNIYFYRQGLTAVKAIVKERTAYTVVCTDQDSQKQGDDQSSGTCYHADEDGFIFEAASSTDGGFLVYDISLPENIDPIGIDFLDSGRLQELASFVGSLAQLGFVDDDIAIPSSGNYDLTLEESEGQKYLVASQENNGSVLGANGQRIVMSSTSAPILHLFIDENRPFAETLEDFSAFWQEYMASSTRSSSKSAAVLSSVDMRYGDNIIYKTR